MVVERQVRCLSVRPLNLSTMEYLYESDFS
ncbi:hypothetical protein VPHD479_0102 [Vibrio phage D479]